MTEATETRTHTNRFVSHEQAPEYLECLHAMAMELEAALQSLATNARSSFQESVSRQLTLCSQLTALAARHRSVGGDSPERAVPPAADELGERIEDAKAKLLKLNRNYSALLKHTGRTVRMFAGLAQCYAGYPHAGASGTPQRTWSSEL